MNAHVLGITRRFSNPSMNSIAHFYREIQPAFLDQRWEQGFEIYYKVEGGEEDRFLKFTDYSPNNHKRIIELMNGDDCQEFYIHENDLIRYYKEFVLQSLKDKLNGSEASLENIKQIYIVCRNILKEYFVNIASTRILRNLDELVPVLETQMREANINFTALFGLLEKDPPVYTHSANVGFLSAFLGIKVNMNPESVKELSLGGMVFDVGKKEVPYDIITKTSELSTEEFKAVRKHPAAGKKILNDMKCYSKNILAMAVEHHEKFDGTGYPAGLSGEKITPFAKICSIMDVFCSLTCDRDHRDSFSPIQALTMMKKEMSGQFDPKFLEAFIKAITARS